VIVHSPEIETGEKDRY
jgi:hypothetical protein